MSDEPIEALVDADLCIGTGNCVFFAPEVFEMGDDHHAQVIDPSARPADDVVHAAQQCPIRAIRVRRGGQQLV